MKNQDWTIYGAVVDVHDGDTFKADLDLGWHLILKGRTVRIAHINAPELRTVPGKADNPAGIAARDYLKSLLLVGDLIIKIVSHEVDKYGRCLATVYNGRNEDVALEMVQAGHAVPYEGGAR